MSPSLAAPDTLKVMLSPVEPLMTLWEVLEEEEEDDCSWKLELEYLTVEEEVEDELSCLEEESLTTPSSTTKGK